ncbi:MAG: class F sortase [Chloroflexota bacterium]
MGSPYRRRNQPRFPWWQLLLMSMGIAMIFFAWTHLNPAVPTFTSSDITPTLPVNLTRADVLPTLTPVPGAPLRQIIFPGAELVASIVDSTRNGPSWEVRYLGASVGHLEGTSWMDGAGGNIVLAGHVEDAEGKPGPFAHLFESKPNDIVILRESARSIYYKVTVVDHAAPDDMFYVAQDGRKRLTMITCDNYDFKTQSYKTRLVVIAEPLQ